MTPNLIDTVDLDQVLTTTSWSVLPGGVRRLLMCGSDAQLTDRTQETYSDGLVHADNSSTSHKGLCSILADHGLKVSSLADKRPKTFQITLRDLVTMFTDVSNALGCTATDVFSKCERSLANKDASNECCLSVTNAEVEGDDAWDGTSTDDDIARDEAALKQGVSLESLKRVAWKEFWDEVISAPSVLARVRELAVSAHQDLLVALPSLAQGTLDPAEVEDHIKSIDEAVEEVAKWRESLADPGRSTFPAPIDAVEYEQNAVVGNSDDTILSRALKAFAGAATS